MSNLDLSALPPEITRLSKLTWLDLRGNPLPIPLEILEKINEPTIVINYYLKYLAAADERRSLGEAKMLLVGQGAVGKTSLARRLVEGTFDPHESKTEGIDIQRWAVTADSRDIHLNVWDFGGQEIMHATHQFFLTKRSLYLLVLDARLGAEENRLEYWLKIIQSFGGDSPVIVVGNKVDQGPLDIDKRGLKAKYSTIKAIVETSCKTGVGIDELQVAIACEVGTLPHVHDELLNTWFAVKERLETMQQNYIPYSEYERMCQEEDVADKDSQHALLGFLHDLGVVLNFQDDPRLEDTNILNPEWVTNGVYRILNAQELFQSQGVLDREMLRRILDYPEYPRQKHWFIVGMMRKFELCFDFEDIVDWKFLVPDLLPKEEPDTGDWRDALAFQYHYSVLPSSVISRFIVRAHRFIYQDIYWRNGVALAYEGNTALIKADKPDKKIFIWVRGPERGRRTLLAIIRFRFDHIHRTIPGIQVQENVPVPGRPEITVSYQHLLNLEEMGIATFVPEGIKGRVSVRQLLDGVDISAGQRLVQLRQLLAEFLSEEDLRTLCFDLGIDYESLPAEGKAGKARELLVNLVRRQRLPDLIRIGRQTRPDVPWGVHV